MLNQLNYRVVRRGGGRGGGGELPFLTKLEKMPYVLEDELIHIF